MHKLRCVAILNQKGGSGKTTTAVNLSASLASEKKKVLLIDMDPQGSASLWLGFKEKGKALYEVLTSEKKFIESVCKTKVEGLDIIPASPVLAGVEKALSGEIGSETILKNKLLKEINEQWDYVLIDCPPTLGILSINALTTAKEVIIPVEAHVMALHGLVQLLKTIQMVQERLNPDLKITGILPCRVDLRTKHSKEVLSQLNTRFKKQIFQSIIRENIRLAEAPLHLKPIFEYDKLCNGSVDYNMLAKEVMGKVVF